MPVTSTGWFGRAEKAPEDQRAPRRCRATARSHQRAQRPGGAARLRRFGGCNSTRRDNLTAASLGKYVGAGAGHARSSDGDEDPGLRASTRRLQHACVTAQPPRPRSVWSSALTRSGAHGAPEPPAGGPPNEVWNVSAGRLLVTRSHQQLRNTRAALAHRLQASKLQRACRSTERGEPFITSYQTVTNEPSSISTVLG